MQFEQNVTIFKNWIRKGVQNTKNFDESKAPVIHDLSGIFLKEDSTLLLTPIRPLCNLSISSGRFPHVRKIAKLKPLFKKGSKTDPKNYHPIFLQLLMLKVLETIVHEQSMEFLDKHNISYKFQSGFRKNHSADICRYFQIFDFYMITASVMEGLTDKISKGFDSSLFTGVILIDLQKGLDAI